MCWGSCAEPTHISLVQPLTKTSQCCGSSMKPELHYHSESALPDHLTGSSKAADQLLTLYQTSPQIRLTNYLRNG
ncbi:hypothetical protein RRG08_063189 [Elysia crispata]|uniref:Uncharacterized protein n=1 Tax=Elysia crispata TaxID=231223 RepID=A0AAE0YU03_9GAST|nr:hypothetical protein RRG08_063189 [Elysia crispata]